MRRGWQNVVAVAIKVGDDVVSLPPPARHVHVLSDLRLRGIDGDEGEQGFLLADGTFASRWNAGRHAKGSGQIEKLKYGNELYSEDLW